MTEQSAVPSSPRRHRSLEVARRIGWILAIPAAAYVIWIIAVARDTVAASESAGRIFGFLLGLYLLIWLIGVVAHRPGIRGWWGWTIVLTAVAVLVLVALPIGNPQDIAVGSYIRDSGGYSYEIDQKDQAAFRAALANSEIPAGDLQEADLYYVKQNGKTVGVLEVMAIRPGVIGASGSFWESIKRGVAKTATSSQEIQIAGQPATVFRASGAYNVLWHHENLALVSSAVEETVAREVATALRLANATK